MGGLFVWGGIYPGEEDVMVRTIHEQVNGLIEMAEGFSLVFVCDSSSSSSFSFDGANVAFRRPTLKKYVDESMARVIMLDFRNYSKNDCEVEFNNLFQPPVLQSYKKIFIVIVDDDSLKLFMDSSLWGFSSLFLMVKKFGFFSAKARNFGVPSSIWLTPDGKEVEIMVATEDEEGSKFLWDDKVSLGEVKKRVRCVVNFGGIPGRPWHTGYSELFGYVEGRGSK